MKRKERKKGELINLKKQLNEEFGCSTIVELEAKQKKYKKIITRLQKEVDADIEEFNQLYEQLLEHIEKRN